MVNTSEKLLFYLAATFLNCFVRNQDNQTWLYCMSMDQYYSYVPQERFKSVVIRNNNEIYETLKSKSFKNITDVDFISINGVLNKIEPDAFTGLKKGNIYLTDNNIQTLKANSFNLNGNFSLVLKGNQIKEIEPGTFGNVESIYLESNNLTKIKKGIFTNLDMVTLSLSMNQISDIEEGAFSGMKKLERLALEFNQLKHFDIKTLFGDTNSLKFLKLTGNPLKTIKSDMFLAVPNLLTLTLGKNQISEIPKGTFNHLESLAYLELRDNQLSKIDPDLLSEKNLLKYLFIDGNNLSFIPLELLSKFKQLDRISIYNNPLQCSCKNEFEKWANGREDTVLVYCVDQTQCVEGGTQCTYDLKSKLETVARIECERADDQRSYFQ